MDKPVEFPAPPSAEQRPFSYERHGVMIEDPWHWIRDPKYPEVTDPDVTVKVNLIGAHEVQPSAGTIRPDEGHIHVSLDGSVVAMAYSTTRELKGLIPGTHSVQVEFVAIDHLPFRNRVIAAILFTVK